jgi:hypothetical protein
MLYWNEYKGHKPDIHGRKNKFDNTIYSFDIETTSYIQFKGELFQADKYQELSKKEQEEAQYGSCMYIWQLSINDIVYYGRTWEELREFIKKINEVVPEKKIIFVHNLAFEFQYLRSYFNFKEVTARKSHKVMKCKMSDYNIEFRCSYMMSNVALNKLPDIFNLPVEKMVGDLDYTKLRTSITPLDDKELKYCENDCLVVYHYIRYELSMYESVEKLPLTSTGHVRRELKGQTSKDWGYKRVVGRAVNTDPHIYNLLIQAFAGGYTHANWLYSDEIVKNVDSWDFTSSYPYVMVTHKFPATKFKPCNIRKLEYMNDRFAYLLVVRFTNIKSKYFNTILSQSKCSHIYGGKYDNGRVISADSLETTITDVDFKLILLAYECEYEILECYYSVYDYLPKRFIKFVLEKYVMKTEYKGVEGMEVEYSRQKSLFNSLYGMSVTNNIRDEVEYDNELGWSETPISNEEIMKKLQEEEKTGFLSFAYGVWITAYARNNLIKNLLKLDEYVLYADTDSLKLKEGYDKNVIDTYNKFVANKIKHVSEVLKIPFEKFAPKDKKGKERMLGLFDDDGHYDEFITQGAKKYAVKQNGEIHITVSGVPKSGVKSLKGDLNNFRNDLVFEFKDTGKNLLIYTENQEPVEITDYLGNTTIANDISGCCILPTTYILGKSQEYEHLLSDESAKRAIYNENL